MKLVGFFLLLIFNYGVEGIFHGHKRNPIRKSLIKSSLPRSPPPKEWRWDNVGGINYLTITKNQHIPQYCGSCWAQAATSALSDRIKIMRNASWPDFNISPQVIISCGPDDGCHGGDSGSANEYMAKAGITDETCSIYRARGHDNGLPCSNLEVCETCDPDADECSTPPKYHKYRVQEYGDVEGKTPKEQEFNMMAEIYHRGPIACGIAVTDELYKNYTGGIFYDTTNNSNIDHDISVVGYGHDEKTGWDYWLIRNSWGTYWGENGYFRLRKGVNNIGIESGTCTWATPENTWSKNALQPASPQPKTHIEEAKPPRNQSMTKEAFRSKLLHIIFSFIDKVSKTKRVQSSRGKTLSRKTSACVVSKGFKNGPKIISVEPKYSVRSFDLPRAWDWRNVDGINYLSWTVNQHIPQYCGSCWAQATLSAIADRFIIADRRKYANLALSPQVIVNCRAGGSCEGGAPEQVYEFLHDVGVPDMTCQVYDAQDHDPVADCRQPHLNVCRDCGWPPPGPNEVGNCWARTNFTRYFVSEYGRVSGAKAMKKEIYKRGPIACTMDVTLKFEHYDGGIYSEKLDTPPQLNHEISIVGWGVDKATGKEFWIGRNSWGTYWGEYGFFRIAMHRDNLGIEESCVWAVPKLQ